MSKTKEDVMKIKGNNMKESLDLATHDLVDPRIEEIQYINNFTEMMLSGIDKNPMEAKRIVHEVMRPYMAAQLRTISILEDQLEGYVDQNHLLLSSNALLIHNCKERNVPMPNFDLMKEDYFANKERIAKQAKTAGIII